MERSKELIKRLQRYLQRHITIYYKEQEMKKYNWKLAKLKRKPLEHTCSRCQTKTFKLMLGIFMCIGKGDNNCKYIIPERCWHYGCDSFTPIEKEMVKPTNGK